MPTDWKTRPDIVVLRERCRVLAQTAWKRELERRKTANKLTQRGWEITKEDYEAADDVAFDVLWAELMRAKEFLCAE